MKRIAAVTLALAALSLVAFAGHGVAQSPVPSKTAVAIFAAGCFWCVEADFDKVEGVLSTTSGYTGGREMDPTYAQVSSGATGHTEAVEIVYDPAKVSYRQLLDHFWRNVDPFAKNRQFCDSGPQYRSAIFYRTDEERALAEASKKAVADKFGRAVETEVAPAAAFYRAEDYHQDFHLKNSAKYKFYRWNCGRDRRLQELWGKASS
ncbi:MAG: peptide-methionine (S)-S-oxide reductase MsrA [Pseudorhodoplanes sp.]|nr:Peptide methionine sulfoxide reductase MsrA [Pseudorhodoplanes sp.]MCL4713114.1 peptide-methionine (S)-S-oxide reductase MsrA [Pseudorhodoplanes sp.]MCQ3942115.1 peptide-methionine (S)-S-oxide reductase [Alphaproteobacteria bacterium]GIK79226.1 MAG: peptide methionine sulfoxide reductase MsrA [Alphaproteobacteria bacterium]